MQQKHGDQRKRNGHRRHHERPAIALSAQQDSPRNRIAATPTSGTIPGLTPRCADDIGLEIGDDQQDQQNTKTQQATGAAPCRRAFSSSSPLVFRLRKIAPYRVKTQDRSHPSQQGIGVEQVEEAAHILHLGVDRHARARCCRKPRPSSSAGSRLPMKMHQSHRLRQRGFSSLLRNSKATPRTISATSSRKSGR